MINIGVARAGRRSGRRATAARRTSRHMRSPPTPGRSPRTRACLLDVRQGHIDDRLKSSATMSWAPATTARTSPSRLGVSVVDVAGRCRTVRPDRQRSSGHEDHLPRQTVCRLGKRLSPGGVSWRHTTSTIGPCAGQAASTAMDGSALHGRRRSRDASGRQPMSYRWQATDLEGLEPRGPRSPRARHTVRRGQPGDRLASVSATRLSRAT